MARCWLGPGGGRPLPSATQKQPPEKACAPHFVPRGRGSAGEGAQDGAGDETLGEDPGNRLAALCTQTLPMASGAGPCTCVDLC